MRFTIQAACGCHTGKVRKNNEDNFYFNGKTLERDHSGLENPVSMVCSLNKSVDLAVFDGMGGECYGEYASYVAARQMQDTRRSLRELFLSERNYLRFLTRQLHSAVVLEKMRMGTTHMGTTMVALRLSGRYGYVCNVGDSRAYRLRKGKLLQLSVDHALKRPGMVRRKAPLTQSLGFGSGEVGIVPHIAEEKLQKGDMYLLCSDGLTDMLSDFEIADIMMNSQDAESCTRELIREALERGGRDNITVIVCCIA